MNSIRCATRFVSNHFSYQNLNRNRIHIHSKQIEKVQSSSLGIFVVMLAIGGFQYFVSEDEKNLKEVSPETQQRIQELSQKMSMQYPVKGYIHPNNENESFWRGLWGSKSFIQISEKSDDFAIAHELAHIKQNHSPKSYITAIACTLVWSQFFQPLTLLTVAPAGAALYCMHLASQTALWRYFEKQADLTAAFAVPNKELAKSIYNLNNLKLHHKLLRELNTDWKTQLQIRKNGDVSMIFNEFPFFVDTHPPFSERLKYLAKIHSSREEVDPTPLTVTVRSNGEDKEIKLSLDKIKEIRTLIRYSSRKYGFIKLDHLIFDIDKGLIFTNKEETFFHRFNFTSKDIDEDVIKQAITSILEKKISLFLQINLQDKESSRALNLAQKMKNIGYVEDRLEKNDQVYIACLTKKQSLLPPE